ncbi:L-threonylcarbamoyladenylate synthase [Phaeocystidibacter luteus]|uniref:Threonylcarbamoyl-AMP synthase n=1 Tax=Phaeocystidibacter luteus TaxID=911197 RepID=A0A6N6RMA6_9FLAO|nr:L-threonylcarbamoyladenylate synthase [Phaeocystidibacter luteus]KAB2814734.1 threonylcarbamoyl-AMP synthase [Phaeocystidibacter luteus]
MAELVKIYPENPQEKEMLRAVETLRNGGLVIFPTDSVYAIGADISQPKALERLARIKGSSLDKVDLSFIFYDLSHLSDFTRQFDTPTYKRLKRALPGPFTFILESNNSIPKLFKSKKKTIGIRVPDNSIARQLSQMLDNPIATTSVHDDDDVIEYTTDPSLIKEKYDALVDLVIDGGFGDNIASTVIDLTGDEPEVIREGKGDPADIE